MSRLWWMILTAPLLGACGLAERFDSPEDRINAAVPVTPAVSSSKLLLESHAGQRPDQHKDIEAQWGARLRVRALTCARGYVPGWHVSRDAIHARLAGETCFAQADQDLKRWLDLQRVRLILAQEPAGTLPQGKPPGNYTHHEPIIAVWGASRAPVVIVRGPTRIEGVDLASGQVLFKDNLHGSVPRLSPNGRLFSHADAGRVIIRAVNGGDTLVELDNAFDLHWLDAPVVALRSRNPSGVHLLDLATGERTPIPGSNEGQALVPFQQSSEDKRFNLVDRHGVQQLALRSSHGRHDAQLLGSRTLPREQSQEMTAGTASSDGALWLDVYNRTQLRIIDMLTLEASYIPLDPIHVFAVWPTAEAGSFLLATNLYEGAGQASAEGLLVYSHGAGTLASVPRDQVFGMVPQYLPGLKRLAFIQGQNLLFAEPLPSDAPKAVADVVNIQIDAMNQRRLAQALQPAPQPSIRPVAPFQQPMIVPKVMFHSNEAKVLTLGAPPRAQAAMSDNIGMGRKSFPPLVAAIPVLMHGAQVEALGVAEGAAAEGGAVGTVDVQVRRTRLPLVLVLSSRDAVRWRLSLGDGANLAAVLVSGHSNASVEGRGTAPLHSVGTAWAHAQGTEDYARLDGTVKRWLGEGIRGFQGQTRGTRFVVGE